MGGFHVFIEVKPTPCSSVVNMHGSAGVSPELCIQNICHPRETRPLGVIWLSQPWATPLLRFATRTQSVLDTSFYWNRGLSLLVPFQQHQCQGSSSCRRCQCPGLLLAAQYSRVDSLQSRRPLIWEQAFDWPSLILMCSCGDCLCACFSSAHARRCQATECSDSPLP